MVMQRQCQKSVISMNGIKLKLRNVKSIRTMAEAMGALMNCEVIWRHIHPMDYGTTAVVRFYG